MIVMPDRWTCPHCLTTIVRGVGSGDSSWRHRLTRNQRRHAERHAAELRARISEATTRNTVAISARVREIIQEAT